MQRNKARYIIEFIIHAMFWLGVYYVLHSLTGSSFSMLTYDNGKITGGVSANMLFPYPWLVLLVLMVMFYGNIFWLFKKLIRCKNKLGLVIAIACWFALLFAVNYLAVRKLTVPANNAHALQAALPRSPVKVAFSIKGEPPDTVHDSAMQTLPAPPQPPNMAFSLKDWWDMQLVMAIIFLAISGIAVAYFFIKEWIRNDLARSQAEAQQYNTEVRFLRSQVNPHFLFNTLNNLFSMAQKKGDDDVADGILKLSGMMRYMIYESNTESVPLQKEIEYLEDCIVLNKLRYAGDEVAVNFSHPAIAAIATVRVAPMLFIPFLENAFKHGVLIGQHAGITMAITINQKKMIFTCENTDYSAVKKLQEMQTGIGLENIKRRLQLVYPGKYTLQAGPADGKFNVNLEIDLA